MDIAVSVNSVPIIQLGLLMRDGIISPKTMTIWQAIFMKLWIPLRIQMLSFVEIMVALKQQKTSGRRNG
ncbi:MAG TPA: hypothetical protein DIW77_16135 [Chromatiaceae bacterium]|nr:MAG: hypothetical protein N838_22670 [Thiohalocapsa sp. PB-PSB1]HCS91523.1 hypothetical protein [Chromatiaceae bacterium]